LKNLSFDLNTVIQTIHTFPKFVKNFSLIISSAMFMYSDYHIPVIFNLKFKFLILFSISLGLSQLTIAQESKSQAAIRHFDGTITATNNGISIIPSFTLGRPAVFFDLSMGGERLSFDPMLRFGMDGKPWTFVFWGRYKLIKDKRFSLTVGGHPAFLFREMPVLINGVEENMLVTQRFLAWEVAPMYKISDRFSLGLYYLQGRGLNPNPPKKSNFLALNTVFSNLPLVKDFRLRVNPQFFFLRVDDNTGTYVTSSITITKTDFPIGIQTIFNQKIKTDIAGDDFLWNVSLLYTFANQYKKD
jgi:hypothetical protein